MRRDRYQASSPAAIRPSRPASASRLIRSFTRWLTSVFFVATTIAPTDVFPRVIGFATAMYFRWVPGGVNSNVSDLPDCQSIVWIGSRLRPVTLS